MKARQRKRVKVTAWAVMDGDVVLSMEVCDSPTYAMRRYLVSHSLVPGHSKDSVADCWKANGYDRHRQVVQFDCVPSPPRKRAAR